MSDDLIALAAEAYVYGFAMVFNLHAVGGASQQGIGLVAPAPFNSFSHASKLAGPDDRFVSINNVPSLTGTRDWPWRRSSPSTESTAAGSP